MITWNVGEALLYEDLESLLKKAKSNGIKNHLIINGRALTKEKIDSIARVLDIVTLCLDSCDNKNNELMGRGYGQYDNIKEIVTYFKTNYPNLKVKINTVCKLNIISPEVLIRTDGTVVVIRNKEDKILGNLLFDDIDIFICNNM